MFFVSLVDRPVYISVVHFVVSDASEFVSDVLHYIVVSGIVEQMWQCSCLITLVLL